MDSRRKLGFSSRVSIALDRLDARHLLASHRSFGAVDAVASLYCAY